MLACCSSEVWLSRRRRRWCRHGSIAVLCLARARGFQRVEDDVLVVSIDRVAFALRAVVGCPSTTPHPVRRDRRRRGLARRVFVARRSEHSGSSRADRADACVVSLRQLAPTTTDMLGFGAEQVRLWRHKEHVPRAKRGFAAHALVLPALIEMDAFRCGRSSAGPGRDVEMTRRLGPWLVSRWPGRASRDSDDRHTSASPKRIAGWGALEGVCLRPRESGAGWAR